MENTLEPVEDLLGLLIRPDGPDSFPSGSMSMG